MSACASVGAATICLAALLAGLAGGCRTGTADLAPAPAGGAAAAPHAEDPLARLVFRPSSLPANVRLAPWKGGSEKLPEVTGNPFFSSDRKFIDRYVSHPAIKGLEADAIKEMALVVYWYDEPGGGPVEIGVTAVRFADAAAALKAKEAIQPEVDRAAKVEPHTAPMLIQGGSVVCIMGHTSTVKRDVWAAMVRLVNWALHDMP